VATFRSYFLAGRVEESGARGRTAAFSLSPPTPLVLLLLLPRLLCGQSTTENSFRGGRSAARTPAYIERWLTPTTLVCKALPSDPNPWEAGQVAWMSPAAAAREKSCVSWLLGAVWQNAPPRPRFLVPPRRWVDTGWASFLVVPGPPQRKKKSCARPAPPRLTGRDCPGLALAPPPPVFPRPPPTVHALSWLHIYGLVPNEIKSPWAGGVRA